MQQTRRPGQKQPPPTPEEIQAECLQIRLEWSFDRRMGAIEDINLCRQLPDWNPVWDEEVFRHREGQDIDETQI